MQRSGFDSQRYQIFWEVVGLERGPFSLASTTEELIGRKSRGSGIESRENGRRDLSHWPCGTLYPRKSWPSGGQSVGIVCSQTQALEFFCFVCIIKDFIEWNCIKLSEIILHTRQMYPLEWSMFHAMSPDIINLTETRNKTVLIFRCTFHKILLLQVTIQVAECFIGETGNVQDTWTSFTAPSQKHNTLLFHLRTITFCMERTSHHTIFSNSNVLC
jgi:hypothetical protein